MRAWICCLVLFIVAIAVLIMRGMGATTPNPVEATLMRGLKHRVFVRNKAQMNPLAASTQTVQEGRKEFSIFCAACNVWDGQNSGFPFADRLSPPVPSLSSKEVQSYTDGQLKWVIDNGIWPS